MIKNINIPLNRTVINSKVILNPDDTMAYKLIVPKKESTLMITAIRADNVSVQDIFTFGDTEFEYIIKKNMYSVPGILELRVAQCTSSGTILTTQYIFFNVVQGTANIIDSTDDDTSLFNMIATETAQRVTQYTSMSEDISAKVDKVDGKALSSNDFSDSEKLKLEQVQEGAQVNIQADWEETNEFSDAYINNKPDIYTKQQAIDKVAYNNIITSTTNAITATNSVDSHIGKLTITGSTSVPVGDLITDVSNINNGKYKIPIIKHSRNLINVSDYTLGTIPGSIFNVTDNNITVKTDRAAITNNAGFTSVSINIIQGEKYSLMLNGNASITFNDPNAINITGHNCGVYSYNLYSQMYLAGDCMVNFTANSTGVLKLFFGLMENHAGTLSIVLIKNFCIMKGTYSTYDANLWDSYKAPVQSNLYLDSAITGSYTTGFNIDKGTTVLEVNTTNVPSQLKCTYGMDINAKLTQLQNAIISLGGNV